MIPAQGQLPGSSFTAQVMAYIRQEVVIEATDSLTSPKWQRIWTNTVQASTPLEFIDPKTVASSQHYYRATKP